MPLGTPPEFDEEDWLEEEEEEEENPGQEEEEEEEEIGPVLPVWFIILFSPKYYSSFLSL